MSIAGDPIACHTGHGTGRTEERFRARQVSRLAQPHIDQMAVAVDGPIQVAPSAMHLDIRLIDVPALAHDTSAVLAKLIGHPGNKLRFPVPHRLVGKHEAALEEHLSEVPQAQLVTQAPEDNEEHDIGGILQPVVRRPSALVETPATVPASEFAVAERCAV
jgi:hypothetical protein